LGDKIPFDLSRAPLDFTIENDYVKYVNIPTSTDEANFLDSENPPVIMTAGH
jgi:hypothetical protein